MTRIYASVLVVALPFAVHAQKPALPDVLQASAAYLQQYATQLGTVAAEEEYTQRETTAGIVTRRLHADVVFVGLDDGNVAGFRDVFALDSREVRPRDDRLLALLKTPSESALAQANAIAEEGIRYYISPNLRVLDMPMLALDFLLAGNQGSSEFSLDSVKKTDGVDVALLKFKMRKDAKVLPTPPDSTTTGRFWVEAATGVVRQTELTVSSKSFMIKVTSKYALDPSLGIWLPSEVAQQSDITNAGSGGFSNMGAGGGMGGRQSLEGRATYSKFRK